MKKIDKSQVTNFLKRHTGDILAVVLFIVIAVAYFFPADVEGRILYRHDSSAGRGAGQESSEYMEKTGERTRWTNSLFSGMPTYQMAPSYDSTSLLSRVADVYHLWLPENVWYVFISLLGFFILLRAFDFRWALAVLGSVVWAFSSYFFIIIAAGHIWKVMALAYLPPMIAGVVYAYRGKYLRGFVLTAIFSALEVQANHVQMTYYYLLIIFFMVLAFLVSAIREKKMQAFGRATAVCIAGALLGICINLSNLYHTWQYGKESMRGATELKKENSADQTSSGLERSYITQWSYGIDETLTLLVPNAKGGASFPLTMSETAMKKADPQFMQIYSQLAQYWGEQPGTSGPVYVGAFVLLLFVLGLFIVKGPMKWALLFATVFSILLSWGKNFMPLTDFFIDYVPMYAKFRTVASILVVAEFTIPLLGMMALKRILEDPKILDYKAKYVIISYLLTAGLCGLFAIFPTHFFSDFISSAERSALGTLPSEYIAPIMKNLTEMRTAVFTSDCWRSFFIITLGVVVLYVYRAKKLSMAVTTWALVILCLIDMWQVNKRYLFDEMFVERSQREEAQPLTNTDRQILEDKALDYRVLNLASNTFNENETSYYHKSIGGYHAAKLQRYQDMIDYYIHPEMTALMGAIVSENGDMDKVKGDSICPVLNALNTRYFIVPLQGGQTMPIFNPYAYGNAWMIDTLLYAKNANDEIEKVGKIDLRHEAVADANFLPELGNTVSRDSTSAVELLSYEPNELKYSVKSEHGGVVVFSEVYYPGWTATIDGNKAEVARVDYILRALRVSGGDHEVVLTFKPASIKATEAVAYAAYVVLLLAICGGIFYNYRRKKEEEKK